MKKIWIVISVIALLAVGCKSTPAQTNNNVNTVANSNTLVAPQSNSAIRGNTNGADYHPPQTPPSNLKTYTNSQYGFQFQYSTDIYKMDDLKDYTPNVGEKALVSVYDFKMRNDPNGDGSNEFTVAVAPNNDRLSSVAYAKKYFPDDYSAAFTERTIAGYKAIDIGELGGHTILVKDNLAFDLYISAGDILKTFKFTK